MYPELCLGSMCDVLIEGIWETKQQVTKNLRSVFSLQRNRHRNAIQYNTQGRDTERTQFLKIGCPQWETQVLLMPFGQFCPVVRKGHWKNCCTACANIERTATCNVQPAWLFADLLWMIDLERSWRGGALPQLRHFEDSGRES